MSSLRGGMKGLVGQGPPRKESSMGKVLSWVLVAGALGLLIYRLSR